MSISTAQPAANEKNSSGELTSSATTSSVTSNDTNNQSPERKKLPTRIILVVGVLILLLLVLGVVGWYYSTNKSSTQLTIPSEDSSLPAQDVPLKGVNGRITSIKSESGQNIFNIESYGTPWQKEWQVIVEENTILTKNSEWQANSFGRFAQNEKVRSLPLDQQEKMWRETLSTLRFEDFKVGDIVYVQANEGQDLLNDLVINSPYAIIQI